MVAAGTVACGDEALDPTMPCPDDPVEARGPFSTDRLATGFVTLTDVRDRTVDENGQRRRVDAGRIQAGFADRSTVTSTPAQIMPLGLACFGLISRPVRSGQTRPLDMESVRVEGTARGEVVAPQTRSGTHVAAGDPLLGTGDESLRFVATATAADGFVSFDVMLDGLRGTVDLTTPDPSAPADLTQEAYPIRWAPAGADWVEIVVTPEGRDIDDGGQVVCRVADDGCFDLPAAATAFLLSGNVDHYTMSVALHRYGALEPTDETFVGVEAVAQTRLTVDNGLFE